MQTCNNNIVTLLWKKNRLLKKINVLFVDILGNLESKITVNTIAEDIIEWNSLNHIILMATIEEQFKIKFNDEELYNLKNINEIVDRIQYYLCATI